MIPLKDCKKGYFYRVEARNFQVGIFNGDTGFIGIRNKFNNDFLDTEYHWDTGAPFGTVHPMKELGLYGTDLGDDQKMFEFLMPIQQKLREEREKEYHEWRKKFDKKLRKEEAKAKMK